MNSKEIFEKLRPTINDIYKSYKYIGISEQEYYDLVLKEITNSKNEFISDISYSDFLKDRMQIILSEKARMLMLSSETSFYIINNYINQEFVGIFDYNDAIKRFRKLGVFFEFYDFIPSQELLIQLINKNNVLNKTIELIMDKSYSQIVAGNLEKILDSELLISIIESYCTLKNIEITGADDSCGYGNNGVSDYLREIGKKPLLSINQERQLAQRMAQGDFKARNQFIESNLRLVVSIAKRYQNRGLSLLDLIQEGNLGMMQAADRYDVNKGYRFSTYATYYIRLAIARAIANKGRSIRLPVYLYNKINAYKATVSKLSLSLNRNPTDGEIANEMGVPISEVTKLHKLQYDTVSINASVGDDEETELENFIPATDETPEDIVMTGILRNEVRELLEKCNLTDIEIKVLVLRYGFNGNEPMSFREIGKQLGLSYQRIQQIEARVIRKIRHSKYVNNFAVYMQNSDNSLERVRENKKMRKMQTIYQYFKDYTRKQVDEMLEKLTAEERSLITLRYGEVLDNPEPVKLSKEQTNKFYGSLVPKMRRLLANPNKEYKNRGKKSNQKRPETESSVSSSSKESDIKKEDYIKMLELLRTPTFNQMVSQLSVKDAVIISLKMGYIDGKYFSTEAIAQFLGIEEEEVRETTKKVLLMYKDDINAFLDNIIEVATGQVEPGKILQNKKGEIL